MNESEIILFSNKFFPDHKYIEFKSIDKGNINNTFLVTMEKNNSYFSFILQRISIIFEDPLKLIRNHKLITDHLLSKVKSNSHLLNGRSFDFPSLFLCQENGEMFYISEGNYWRALKYIKYSKTIDTLSDFNVDYELGYGLGLFHKLICDIRQDRLNNVIKNFHDIEFYIARYKYIYKKFISSYYEQKVIYNRLLAGNDFLFKYLDKIDYLNKDINLNIRQKFIIHGDPKLNNFLFNKYDNRFLSLVDLDTVSVGYLLTDLADCLRSACNLSGEEPNTLDSISFDIEHFENILKGYLSIAADLNSPGEIFYLPEFILLITFELGIRFLTDFIDSNSYFKIDYYSQNIYRAEVQFRLFEDIVLKFDSLKRLTHDLSYP